MRRRVSFLLALVASVALLAGSVSAASGPATTGGGHFLYQGFLDVQFGFSSITLPDGRAVGSFHQSYTLNGLTTSYWGTVTCMATDDANHRAWVGGVLTKVETDDPSVPWRAGDDAWFRVLDNGNGGDAAADRSTVFGFKGVIETSEEYCRLRIWPAGDARTWPVTAGNIDVR